jgi:hypothetical protein
MNTWRKVDSLAEALKPSDDRVYFSTPEYDRAIESVFARWREQHPELSDEQLVQVAFQGGLT